MSEPAPKKGIPFELIVQLVLLVMKYAPGVVEAIQKLKKPGDPDPTAAEVRALMDGVLPPDEY